MDTYGAKNLTKAFFPDIADAKFSFVSSMAPLARAATGSRANVTNFMVLSGLGLGTK